MSGDSIHFKAHPTIGACGIDCGLCPRYNTEAESRCPGCAAPGFLEIGGQWCKMTRCAVRDRGYETCADCEEFPCYRFVGWDESDSFVSHLKSVDNLRAIRDYGLQQFLNVQQVRMELLEAMLREFDEGRSKSYCCRAAALLPVKDLVEGVEEARRLVGSEGPSHVDRRARAQTLHRTLDSIAERMNISLKLRKQEK
ncbi:DUF3795 domain-containing protein [Chloroflexota bacterium]